MKYYLKSQLLITSCINIGHMILGYMMGWSSPILPKLLDPEQSPLPNIISETQASFIVSSPYTGGLIATPIILIVANTKGRKPCLLISATANIIAFTVLALANTLIMIYISRILMGIGVGILVIIHVVYIGEIASTNIRGILLTVVALHGTLGIFLAYSTAPFISFASTAYIGLALSIFYLVGVCFLPESPLFYLLKDDDEQLKKCLHSLGRSDDYNTIITKKNDVNNPNVVAWKELFTMKDNIKALFISASLQVLQQMSGIIVIIYFATSIFILANSSVEPAIANIIIGATQLVGSIVAPILVEKSRRILLLLSSGICFLSLLVLGVYFYLDETEHSSASELRWLPLVVLILYMFAFDIGLGAIPATLTGEMFRLNVRSIGTTFTMVCAWISGFVSATAFVPMVTALGAAVTFWIFSGVCAIIFLFTIAFVPETKGKTLFEIQKMMNKSFR